MTRAVVVFRSSRVDDMYLYVDAAERLSRVPSALLERFGSPVEALNLDLDPERRLARVRAVDVLDAIAQQGFYLQMPPVPEQWQRRG